MEEFERIERLLREKKPNEWSIEEKEFLSQHLGEDPALYQQTMTEVKEERRPVDRSVKQELMEDFRQQGTPVRSILSWKLPAYSNLVAASVTFLIAWWIFDQPVEVQPVERLVEVVKRDTVEIATIDTVFVDRFIEVPKTVYVALEAETPEIKEAIASPQNKALSESQELLDLVVRSD